MARQKASDDMLLIGGSFGSPHGEPWRIAGGNALKGTITNSLYLPVDIGSVASTIDGDGKLLLLGGWAETEEVTARHPIMLLCPGSCVYSLHE
jgi:hypothetical protein